VRRWLWYRSHILWYRSHTTRSLSRDSSTTEEEANTRRFGRKRLPRFSERRETQRQKSSKATKTKRKTRKSDDSQEDSRTPSSTIFVSYVTCYHMQFLMRLQIMRYYFPYKETNQIIMSFEFGLWWHLANSVSCMLLRRLQRLISSWGQIYNFSKKKKKPKVNLVCLTDHAHGHKPRDHMTTLLRHNNKLTGGTCLWCSDECVPYVPCILSSIKLSFYFFMLQPYRDVNFPYQYVSKFRHHSII